MGQARFRAAARVGRARRPGNRRPRRMAIACPSGRDTEPGLQAIWRFSHLICPVHPSSGSRPGRMIPCRPPGGDSPMAPSGGGYPMPPHGGTHLPPSRPFGRVGMGRHGRMTASSTGRMRPPLPPHPAVRRAFPPPSPGCARLHPHFPQTNPQPVDNCGAISHAVPCRTALSHPRFYAVGGGRFGGMTNHGSVTFS